MFQGSLLYSTRTTVPAGVPASVASAIAAMPASDIRWGTMTHGPTPHSRAKVIRSA
jgi:hypothetical protein